MPPVCPFLYIGPLSSLCQLLLYNTNYLIPNIVIRKTKPLGHYGRLRKAYLEMRRPILFNELVLSDKLFEHCAEIDEAARNRMELIVRSLAEEVVKTELIYD